MDRKVFLGLCVKSFKVHLFTLVSVINSWHGFNHTKISKFLPYERKVIMNIFQKAYQKFTYEGLNNTNSLKLQDMRTSVRAGGWHLYFGNILHIHAKSFFFISSLLFNIYCVLAKKAVTDGFFLFLKLPSVTAFFCFW